MIIGYPGKSTMCENKNNTRVVHGDEFVATSTLYAILRATFFVAMGHSKYLLLEGKWRKMTTLLFCGP
jgi:hypothetical protein